MTRSEFTEAVFTLGLLHGASTTSWFRSTKRNTAVGGVPGSAHRFGLGVDLVYDSPPNITQLDADARRLGLRVLREGDHDHVQPLDWAAG